MRKEIEERIKDIDKLIHIYENRFYNACQIECDRYDLGALHRLRNEKSFLLDLLKEIK